MYIYIYIYTHVCIYIKKFSCVPSLLRRAVMCQKKLNNQTIVKISTLHQVDIVKPQPIIRHSFHQDFIFKAARLIQGTVLEDKPPHQESQLIPPLFSMPPRPLRHTRRDLSTGIYLLKTPKAQQNTPLPRPPFTHEGSSSKSRLAGLRVKQSQKRF